MTNEGKALITAEFDPKAIASLQDMGYEVELAGWGQTRHALSRDELIAHMRGVSLLIVEVEEVSAAVIAAARELRVIAACRAAPVNVDIVAATQRGIPVLATPGRNADSVADFCVGLMLALCRNICRGERHLRQEGWFVHGDEQPYFHFRGPEIAGKTLGIIGFGAIGKAFARRARGLDMEVLVADPYIRQEALDGLARLVSLETLLRESDVVSLHVPLNGETLGLLNAERLALMKPSAYLINTARAAVVDEDALFGALAAGRIAGAALDVFWEEPKIAPRWFDLENVVLTPHLAGAADDVKVHHSAMIVEDIRALRRGDAPARLVNPSVFVGRNARHGEVR